MSTSNIVFPNEPRFPLELAVYTFVFLEKSENPCRSCKKEAHPFLTARLVSKLWNEIITDPRSFKYWRRLANYFGANGLDIKNTFSILQGRYLENRRDCKNVERGINSLKGRDHEKAHLYFTKAASHGNAIAITYLSQITQQWEILELHSLIQNTYISNCPFPLRIADLADEFNCGSDCRGLDILEFSPLKAFYFHRIAAKNGEIVSQLFLANYFVKPSHDRGFHSVAKAIKWAERAFTHVSDYSDEYGKHMHEKTKYRALDLLTQLQGTKHVSMKFDEDDDQRVSAEKRKSEEEIQEGQPETKKRRKDSL